MKALLILAKALEKQKLNFSSCALFHMKTRASLRYSVSYCSLSENAGVGLSLKYIFNFISLPSRSRSFLIGKNQASMALERSLIFYLKR